MAAGAQIQKKKKKSVDFKRLYIKVLLRSHFNEIHLNQFERSSTMLQISTELKFSF